MAGVTITITGKNGVSQTFQAIERDATGLAVSVEGAGKRGAAAMEQLGTASTQTAAEITQSSERAEASAESIGSAIGKAGLAFGAFTLIAGQAAGESEASSARMQTAFQSAGLAVEDYQGQITQLTSTGLHLAFDDEDVQDALSRFVTQTGNVTKSIKDVQLAEDLARGTNVSLASATATVAAAEAGRTRGLVALVGNLGATATKEDYLAAAQAKYAGSAQAYATTNAAAFDRYKNSAENALEAIGGKLESLQMPILAISTAGAALGPMVGTLKEIANAEKTAEIAGAAMDLALGPVGLAAAALAAGAAIYMLAGHTKEFDDVARTAVASTQDLTNYFTSLAASVDPAKAAGLLSFNTALNQVLEDAAQRQTDLQKIQGLADMGIDPTMGLDINPAHAESQVQALSGMTQANLDYLDTNHDMVLSIDEVNAAIQRYTENTDRLKSDQVTAVQNDVKDLFTHAGINFNEATDAVLKLNTQFQAGAITGDQYAAAIKELDANFSQFIHPITTATTAIDANGKAISANGQAIANQMAAYAGQNDSLERGIEFQQKQTDWLKQATAATVSNGQAVANQMATYEAQNHSLEQSIEFQQKQSDWLKTTTKDSVAYQSALVGDASALAQMGQSQGAVAVPASQLTEAVKQQAQAMKDNEAAAQAASAAIADYRNRLGEVHMVVNDGTNQFAKHATVAGNALDAGNQVIVGNTNAIAQQSQGVADWADKLIGVKGVYAEIDKLIAKGVIDSDEYRRAQSAETSILHSNAAIQRDILKIQTDQAPVMARLVDGEQQYMDKLAKMPAEQQLVTLGFMDSAESAKALAAQQLAVSAASGELGKNGVETANKMIIAAAEADPVLEAMLQNMHLITVGADGTISVNYDEVTGGKSETGLLIDAIHTLDEDIKTAFHIGVEAGDVDAAYRITVGLNSQLDALQNRTITYSVVGNYSTTGTGSGAVSVGGSSDQDTMSDGAGSSPGGGGPPLDGGTGNDVGIGAYNGGVPGYANGGAVRSWLSEIDPELVHLAGGGMAIAPRKGIYDVPQGSYVSTAPATRSLMGMGPSKIELHLHAAGSIVGVDDITDLVIKDLVPALVAASGMHSAGYGV